MEELTAETDRQIEMLKKDVRSGEMSRRNDYKENSEKMLNLVVEAVLNVNPQIPEKMKKSA